MHSNAKILRAPPLLKRQSKTEKQPKPTQYRVLIVDDDPDAARLYGKLLRREGFEVAEVGDHQVALIALANEPEPISVLLASFSIAGTSACLKLLDSVRNHPQTAVMSTRVVLIIDTPKQQLFTWQSGVDDVLLRPFNASEMVELVIAAALRPDGDRPLYRRQNIDAIRDSAERPTTEVISSDTDSALVSFH